MSESIKNIQNNRETAMPNCSVLYIYLRRLFNLNTRNIRNFAIVLHLAFSFIACLPGNSHAQVGDVIDMEITGDPGNRIDLVILGDGFLANQMGEFATAADELVEGLFLIEPYRTYRSLFNVRRIEIPSNQTGAGQDGIPGDTVYGSFFDCHPDIPHLLCVDEDIVEEVLVDNNIIFTQRDLVIVLVNDTEYGGSGSPGIAVASRNTEWIPIAMHEIGHSFGQLKDEYSNDETVCLNAVGSANTTSEVVAQDAPWGHWFTLRLHGSRNPRMPSSRDPVISLLGQPGSVRDLDFPNDPDLNVGHYEGAHGCEEGMFRPTPNSMMRTIGRPLGNVNIEAIVHRIHDFIYYTDDISVSVPPQREAIVTMIAGQPPVTIRSDEDFYLVTPRSSGIRFTTAFAPGISANLEFDWRIDDQPVSNAPSITLTTDDLPFWSELTVTIRDTTPRVKNDPTDNLIAEQAYNLVASRF